MLYGPFVLGCSFPSEQAQQLVWPRGHPPTFHWDLFGFIPHGSPLSENEFTDINDIVGFVDQVGSSKPCLIFFFIELRVPPCGSISFDMQHGVNVVYLCEYTSYGSWMGWCDMTLIPHRVVWPRVHWLCPILFACNWENEINFDCTPRSW